MPRLRPSRRAFLIGLASVAATATILHDHNPFATTDIKKGVRADTGTPESEPDYDVCIIGSGPAGTTLGRDLVAQGLRTILIESGIDLRSDDYDPRLPQLDAYRSVGPVEYPLTLTRLRGLGGTSELWTGRCERMHPIDFEQNAYTPTGAGWPFSYKDLEPYYDRAEHTLNVRGSHLSQYHAPQNGSFPTMSRTDISKLQALMRTVDITVDIPPTSESKTVEGPVRASLDILPDFLASEDATLRTGLTATRLLLDADGSVSGVEVKNLAYESETIHAQKYVVACGGVESARLLLLSRSAEFPHGIGNSNDLVGRHFNDHFHRRYVGTIPNQLVNESDFGRTHQFYDQLKEEGLGSTVLTFAWREGEKDNFEINTSVEMLAVPQNRIMLSQDNVDYFGNPGVDLWLEYPQADRDTEVRVKEIIDGIFEGLAAKDVYHMEETGHDWGHHHLGTVRMGDDPSTSVVNADLQVHKSPNLYVLSSGTFVTSGPGHPTIVVVALAHRLAEHLAQS